MLVATGLAVVIPQGNAFGDDVNFCVGSGASPANAGDGSDDCGSNTAGEVVDCSWINWEKGSSLGMENLITL
jgi:hypothetical protein